LRQQVLVEGLVRGEQAVPPGERVPLQPALAEVFAEHLHHPSAGRQRLVAGVHRQLPAAVGGLEHGSQPVAGGLVR
jgi:hypothetical protein